jgi:hypothetical protein
MITAIESFTAPVLVDMLLIRFFIDYPLSVRTALQGTISQPLTPV